MVLRRMFTILFVMLICLISSSPALSGGWAVITLETLPGNVAAGEPFQVSFRVRQHGQRFVDDLSPRVIASHAETGEEVIVTAGHGEKEGQYTAELILSEPGTWRWSIKTWHQPRMPDLHVSAPGSPATQPPESSFWFLPGAAVLLLVAIVIVLRARRALPKAAALAGIAVILAGLTLFYLRPEANTLANAPVGQQKTQAETGHDLFIAKGCLSCHVNERIEPRYLSFSSQIGPNLSDYPTTAEYLREWLADPTSLKPTTQMPDLELSEDEIEALITFLMAEE